MFDLLILPRKFCTLQNTKLLHYNYSMEKKSEGFLADFKISEQVTCHLLIWGLTSVEFFVFGTLYGSQSTSEFLCWNVFYQILHNCSVIPAILAEDHFLGKFRRVCDGCDVVGPCLWCFEEYASDCKFLQQPYCSVMSKNSLSVLDFVRSWVGWKVFPKTQWSCPADTVDTLLGYVWVVLRILSFYDTGQNPE